MESPMAGPMDQGRMDQDLGLAIQPIQAIQVVPNPIKSTVRVAEKKSLFKFPRQMIKNCCAWIVSENRRVRVHHSS